MAGGWLGKPDQPLPAVNSIYTFSCNHIKMDFPLQLIPTRALNTPEGSPYGSNLEFAYGQQELRNTLYLLLKTIRGRFLQNIRLGSLAVPHMLEDVFLESAIRRCLESVSGLQCDAVVQRGDTFYIRVVYQGKVQEFNFNIRSFE